MSHYFENDASLSNERHVIDFTLGGKQFSLLSSAGVFSKKSVDRGSEVLLKHLISLPLHGSLVDLGAGIGTIGIVLKSLFPALNVTMLEVNQRAKMLAEENVKRHQVAIDVHLSDSFAALADDQKFDLVVLNPPIRAGKEVIYRLFKDSHSHLKDGGSLYYVMRKSHGAPSAQKYIATLFTSCRPVDRDRGYIVYRAIV